MPGFNITGDSGPSNKNVEFHRSHRWIIEDLGFPIGSGSDTQGLPGSTRTRAASPGAPAGAAQLALYAQSIQLPAVEFEEEKIESASLVYRVAKRANWKPVTAKFYDVWGLYQIFEEWQRKIWNVSRGIQAAVDYKGQPVFALTDGAGEVKQRYTLMGAYPSNITHGDLSYTESNVKLLVVTYSFDYAEVELLDELSGSNFSNNLGGTRTR